MVTYVVVIASVLAIIVAAVLARRAMETRLLLAASAGDVARMRKLLRLGAPVGARARKGEEWESRALGYHGSFVMRHRPTALHVAAQRGHLEAARLLAECGASLLAVDDNGNTVLDAASNSLEPDLHGLLEGELKATPEPPGPADPLTRPLIRATRAGRAELVGLLLDRGADPDAIWLDQTAFEEAAAHDSPELLDVIERKGHTVGAHNRLALLHGGARGGRLDLMRRALDAGASVHERTPSAYGMIDRTALHLASDAGHDDAIDWLLERGANPNARDERGSTPLHTAVERGDVGLVRKLLDAGAEHDVRRYVFSSRGRLSWDEAQELMGRDSPRERVERPDKGLRAEGPTPYELALDGNELEIVELLWDAGASTAGALGSLLSHAEPGSSPPRLVRMVRRLLDEGADPGALRPLRGPISQAIDKELTEIEAILREYGPPERHLPG